MSDGPSAVIVPATSDRWSDVAALLGGDGERGCWCQSWRGRDEIARVTSESRPATIRRQLEGEPPTPGFLAYIDGMPVGWAGVGIRTDMPRLMRSRTIPIVDDAPVWVIGCLRVRPGHRRHGIANALLRGVVEAAKAAGAPGVEAYPIDPGSRRVDVGSAFVGIASMFDAAGFHRIRETAARSAGLPRILMRLDLVGSTP